MVRLCFHLQLHPHSVCTISATSSVAYNHVGNNIFSVFLTDTVVIRSIWRDCFFVNGVVILD